MHLPCASPVHGCFPTRWTRLFLPETYFAEGNLGEEDVNTTTSAKKSCKQKGKKTQKRFKSIGTASSASEASLAQAKTNTQMDEERAKQVMQELHLSSEGSNSEVLEVTGNPSQGANPEDSGMGPPGPPKVPDEEPSILPGMLSLDQVPGNGQDKPVPPQPDVNPPDPDTSALNPSPMPAEQTVSPSLNPPDGSMTAAPGPGPGVPLGQDQSVTPSTTTTVQAGSHPHTYSFAGVMDGLKEVCSIMTTGFQHACLDVEAIVHRLLEGATQLNQNLTEAAAQDLDTWASALQPVLDSAGVSDTDMEARRGHARKTGREISNRILSLPNLVVGDQQALGEPVKTALLESFAVANAQCSHSWEEVADWIPDIMTKHVLVDQAQMFLAAVHQLLCTQYQAITTMVAAQTGPPVCFGMYNWGTQVSLTQLLAQAILALGSLEHAMLVSPSTGTRPTPQPQKERSSRAASANTTVYTPLPPHGSL